MNKPQALARTCAISGQPFTISPFEQSYCAEHDLPLPTLAPTARLQRMLIFRNRMYLFTTRCALTKKEILSAVPPDCGAPIYAQDAWESEDWSAEDYAQDYDFSKPFFPQFKRLFMRVPRPALGNGGQLENSDYTNGVAKAKNCYLVFSSHVIEDCMLSRASYRARDICESILVYDSEICFRCENIKECYNLSYSKHCSGCSDSQFLYNCQSCRDCFGCVNLTQKQYCWFNEQLSADEYQRRVSEIDLGSYTVAETQQMRFDDFCKQFPFRAHFGTNNENVTGDYINNSKNCFGSNFIAQSEDIENSLYLERAKNSICHVNFGADSELSYNCISVGESSFNLKFCSDTWAGVRDLEYCINVRNNTYDCFGCVSVKQKSYCILNKRYLKDDYFEAVNRIKTKMKGDGEYGNFFPLDLAPNPYNRSDAGEFFPLTKEQALAKGFSWHDEEPAEDTSSASIPDHIQDADEAIAEKILRCELSGKRYRITKAELDYYKRRGIPLPRSAQLERLRSMCRNFFEVKPLVETACSGCGKKLSSSHTSASRKLLCEECFAHGRF